MKIAIATAIVRAAGNIEDVINVGVLFTANSRPDEEIKELIIKESEVNINLVKDRYGMNGDGASTAEYLNVYINIVPCADIKGMVTALINISKTESNNWYEGLPIELKELLDDFFNGELPIDSEGT